MIQFFFLLLFVLAGAGITLAIARVNRAGRAVTGILFVSYALRAGLAVGLYVVSAWRLPILSSLHLEGGFWRFSPDAQSYHRLGIAVADGLRWGTGLPDFRFFGDVVDFALLTGLVYRIFGAHPLYVPLLNAALCSGILGLVYWFGKRLNGERAGLVAVALVGVWPSMYVWSAQALKDVLVLGLMLGLLAAVTLVVESGRRLAPTVGAWVALVTLGLLLARFRFYAVGFVIIGLSGVVVMRLLASSRSHHRRTVKFGAACVATLLACLVVGRALNPVGLLTPTEAEVQEGHLRKAEYLEQQGDADGALVEFALANGHIPPRLPAAAVDEILTPQFPQGAAPVLERLSLEEAKGPAPPPEPEVPQFLVPHPPPPYVPLIQQALIKLQVLQMGFLTTNAGGILPEASKTGVRVASDLTDAFVQIPHAVATTLWAPFPWQWFRTDGGTGAFRQFSAFETLLLVLLTPWIVTGLWRGLRTGRDEAWLLIGYSMPAAVLMGLVVLNLGTLFRLRLQALIPLLIVAAAYGAQKSKLVTRLISSVSTSPGGLDAERSDRRDPPSATLP